MKVLVGAFNKKKALVAPPIIVKTFAKFRCQLYYPLGGAGSLLHSGSGDNQ